MSISIEWNGERLQGNVLGLCRADNGSLTIGACDGTQVRLIPERFADFLRVHAGVTLASSEAIDIFAEIIPLMEAGSADLLPSLWKGLREGHVVKLEIGRTLLQLVRGDPPPESCKSNPVEMACEGQMLLDRLRDTAAKSGVAGPVARFVRRVQAPYLRAQWRTKQAKFGLRARLFWIGKPRHDRKRRHATTGASRRSVHRSRTPRPVELLRIRCSGTAALLDALAPFIDWPRAVLRGEFMKAMGHVENNGIPIDTPILALLDEHWESLQTETIRHVDVDFGVYEGIHFREDRFARWLALNGVPWPRRYKTNDLDINDETFKDMAESYPILQPLRQLRQTLSILRLADLPVGRDGRNRCLMSPFGTITGRCTPSTSKFIFSRPAWMRSLIRPEEGRASCLY